MMTKDKISLVLIDKKQRILIVALQSEAKYGVTWSVHTSKNVQKILGACFFENLFMMSEKEKSFSTDTATQRLSLANFSLPSKDKNEKYVSV